MVESFILNLFFALGILFGVIGGGFLPSDIYLSWLNYGNVGFVSGVGTVITTAPIDVMMGGGEKYEAIRQSWNKVDPTISDTVVCMASCSAGLLVGGNIGHKVRIRITEPLKVIKEKCGKLAENLESERQKLGEIGSKTRAEEIKKITGDENSEGMKKINFDSIKLIGQIESLIDKYSD